MTICGEGKEEAGAKRGERQLARIRAGRLVSVVYKTNETFFRVPLCRQGRFTSLSYIPLGSLFDDCY